MAKFKDCFVFGCQGQNCIMKEAGINYEGTIFGCEEYHTQADIEAACKSNADCLGYNMHNGPDVGTRPDADGYKPFCMNLNNVNNVLGLRVVSSDQLNYNHYKKSTCEGKKHIAMYFYKSKCETKILLYSDT